MSAEDEDVALLTLKAGEVLHYDFRTDENKRSKLGDTFRVVQWNIERGSQLEGIIDALRACDADILLLQELDVDCRRSGYINVPREIAKALGMQVYFFCEFEELDSARRKPEHGVGPLSPPFHTGSNSNAAPRPDPPLPLRLQQRQANGTLRHFHGNAVLSRRATLRDPVVIPHSANLDWEAAGQRLCEPRHGGRCALRVTIAPQDRTSAQLPPVYLYCCHFEVFCGILMRVRQLGDCLNDAKQLLNAAKTAKPATATTGSGGGDSLPAFIIAGDLNTMAHGIVRFSKRYATDRMRVLSVGETEACWLQRKVLSRGMGAVTRGCCPFSYRFPSYIAAHLYEFVFNSALVWRLFYGVTGAELARLDNRDLCFFDPGDKYLSITLDNPEYKGWVRGKFDWLLLSNLRPRPFRRSRGGARPVALEALQSQRSILTPSTIAYLRGIANSSDEQRELSASTADAATPRDGYILFNEDYTASDHKGLVMTVQQNVGSAQQVYPEYGALYTRSWYATTVLAVSRALPLALVGWVVYNRFAAQP